MGELERIQNAKASWEHKKTTGQNTDKFSAMYKGFEKSYERKRNKYNNKTSEPKEILTCTCGQKIRMFKPQTTVKCYRCNHYWDKTNDEWTMDTDIPATKGLTIANITIKTRNKVNT